MAEYAVVIEAWFEADNDEDAAAVSERLRDRVKEHPSVSEVETQRPEEI